MNLTAIAILLNVKESVDEADNLPKNLHKSVIAVAKVVTGVVCRLVGCVGYIGCGVNRLLELVSTTVVAEIVTVVVLVSESRDFSLINCTAIVVATCNFFTCNAALGCYCFFVICEGVNANIRAGTGYV